MAAPGRTQAPRGQAWRGHQLDDRDFARLDGRHKALVEIELDERLVLLTPVREAADELGIRL